MTAYNEASHMDFLFVGVCVSGVSSVGVSEVSEVSGAKKDGKMGKDGRRRAKMGRRAKTGEDGRRRGRRVKTGEDGWRHNENASKVLRWKHGTSDFYLGLSACPSVDNVHVGVVLCICGTGCTLAHHAAWQESIANLTCMQHPCLSALHS